MFAYCINIYIFLQIYSVIVHSNSNKKHDKWTYHVSVISFFRLAPFFYLKNNPKNDNLSLNCTFFNYHNCTSIIFSGTQIFLPKKSIASPPKNHYIEQKLPSPRLPCFQKNIWALFQYLASNGAPWLFQNNWTFMLKILFCNYCICFLWDQTK